MTKTEVNLFGYPLNINKKITTYSGLRCFHLIWLKCCYAHNFSNIMVTKKDREQINLPRISYIRGIKDLEKDGIITTDRKNGRAVRISVIINCLSQKSKKFVLNGEKNYG